MFFKSQSGLRREHRELVFRVGQGGDGHMPGEMEGAEAKPIPAVGLRSFGLLEIGRITQASIFTLMYSEMADVRRHTGIAITFCRCAPTRAGLCRD